MHYRTAASMQKTHIRQRMILQGIQRKEVSENYDVQQKLKPGKVNKHMQSDKAQKPANRQLCVIK